MKFPTPSTLAILLAAMLLATLPAPRSAQAGDFQPLAKVKALYAPYQGLAPVPEIFLDQLAPIAAPKLRALLDHELSCQHQYLKACNYPFNVIVNGESYQLSELRFELAAPSKETVKITAMFKNFGQPSRLIYLFRKSGTNWLLEDVQSLEGEAWTLVKLLR
ncbi:MAG: hypothetical protein AB7E32_09170 [Desulfovibrio sp.]